MSVADLRGGSEFKVNNIVLCTVFQYFLCDLGDNSVSGCEFVYYSKKFERLWQRPCACGQTQMSCAVCGCHHLTCAYLVLTGMQRSLH